MLKKKLLLKSALTFLKQKSIIEKMIAKTEMKGGEQV